jgi:N-glycosidase YbiA
MINSFRGAYRFLSNFYSSPITVGGILYPTVEHAYQAAKLPPTHDVIHKQQEVARAPSPAAVKALGRRLSLRVDWEDIKIQVMEDLLIEKFKDPNLRRRLLSTGTEELVEENWWGDRFWGVYKGEGRNELGKALMRVRGHYRSQL